ncbi:MAG: corrinoid protein-associated methyltransferase CpaM [Promethearchaeota archaeon]
MSYVYMLALEKKAEKYDKGIQLLTFKKLDNIQKDIIENYVKSEDLVLEIGMGTGNIAILCAKKGIKCIGFDNSDKMLSIARDKLKKMGLLKKIKILKLAIIEMDSTFEDNMFDKVIASLVFSELYKKEQYFCLKEIFRVLRDDRELILIDEVKPKKIWKKLIFELIRIPLLLITFFKTHLSTRSLNEIDEKLQKGNFEIIERKHYLYDSLIVIRAKKLRDDAK